MRVIVSSSLLALTAVVLSCSESSNNPVPITGGTGGSGTAETGGTSSGGQAQTGGKTGDPSGGTSTGGTSAGGTSTGGTMATGGKAANTGGKASSGTGGKGAGGSLATGGGAGKAATGGAGGASTGGSGGAVTATGDWLTTKGNRIVKGDGSPFRGRGANLHDTRSCDACSGQAPNPTGLMKWSDELIDNWKANFIRLNLWSFADNGGYRVQWKSLVDDPQYYADIQTVVNHMTGKPGVYVMVTLFLDPSMPAVGQPHAEWPTEKTQPVYKKLAEAFVNNPRVLFGLMNEPQDPASENPALEAIFKKSIETIRAVETANGTPPHIIVAQATQNWSRDLSYWLAHPLGANIAYEVHAYNPPSDFNALFVNPGKTLPVLIGEFGYSQYQTIAQAQQLMEVAEANEIPWIAWSFHQRCDPNLIADKGGSGYDGCGFAGAGTTYTWPVTDWGKAVKDRLAMPW